MAWIESHQELSRHPKTRKAARRLDVSIPTVMGHLHCLWHWALTHALDGDLTGYDEEDIALGALWDGEPEDFINALVEAKGRSGSGFLERDESGLRLHDWSTYTSGLRNRKEAAQKANHVRWHSDRKVVDPSCPWCRTPNGNPSGNPTGVGEDSTKPNQTRPTRPTEPDLTTPTTPGDGDANGASAGKANQLAEYLVDQGWDERDVGYAIKRLSERQLFGEPIRDPVAWLTPMLQSMGRTREDAEPGRASRVVELDGVPHELVDGQWREVVPS